VIPAETIVRVLGDLRLHATSSEQEIHRCIANLLQAAGIAFEHECRLGKGSRVDFLCADGVAIEVKRGKPPTAVVIRQVERYCESDRVRAVILVLERGLIRVPTRVQWKQVRTVVLTTNWGIST
jgi:hypothetical protein